jgi:hypothetical protein
MTLARGGPSYANIGSKRLFQETLSCFGEPHARDFERSGRRGPRARLRCRGPGAHLPLLAADRIICWRRIKISASRRTLDWNSLSFLRSMTSRAHSGVGCEWFGFHDARHGDGTL